MDMLLVELYGVSTHGDLEAAGISDVSIAEFEGRWFLGLWAGRLTNVCELLDRREKASYEASTHASQMPRSPMMRGLDTTL